MQRLLLKFEVSLIEYILAESLGLSGPIFHRWLPDGEKDALKLKTEDSNVEVRVWFDRLEAGRSRLIDYFRRVKPEDYPPIISQTGALQAGLLTVQMKIQEPSLQELDTLTENKVGDEIYLNLGKKVVKKWFYPPLSKFINILRVNFGQYWITELREWDSRVESLGAYCQAFYMQWSIDNGKTWNFFVPDEFALNVAAGLESRKFYLEYITEEDWKTIQAMLNDSYEPSLATFNLSQTHKFLDEGNLKNAFIQGIIALELALEEFLRSKLQNSNLFDKIQAFRELNLPARLITITATMSAISIENIKDTVEAINIRNKIVHEGKGPADGDRNYIYALLETVKSLLSGVKLKFPSISVVGKERVMTEEGWDRE